jgi:hypothetical protein
MKPRSIGLLAGGSLLALGGLLHLLTCSWTSEDTHSPPPLIALRKHVTISEEHATKYRIAEEQLQRILKQIDELVGTDTSSMFKKLDDPVVRAKHSDLVDEMHLWQTQMDEAGSRAFGTFGLYPRGGRDTGLIAGIVTPAILLVGGLSLVVWGLSQKSKPQP